MSSTGYSSFARRGSGDTVSGLWHSDFENVRVYNFGGVQMWLQGGGSDARDPIQFLTFRNVVLERQNNSARSIGLIASGQVNQTCWLGGRIDGFGSSGDHPGTNVKICRQLKEYDPSVDGSSAYVSNRSGHLHLFAGVTFQQADLAVYVDHAESITFDTCHFEGLNSGLLFSGGGGNRVDRSHFANSGGGSQLPYSIRAQNGSAVSGSANVFLGQFGDMAVVDDESSSVNLSNSLGNDAVSTRGVTKLLTVDETIDVGCATTVALDASTKSVRYVSSSHFPGEQIVMKAVGGSVFFDAGGNIDFEGTRIPVEITAGGTMTLVRMDFGLQWSVVAMHGVRVPDT